MTDPVRSAFQILQEQLVAEAPELQTLLDRGKTGELPESELLREMMAFVHQRPELARKFMQMAQTALAPLRQSDWSPLPPGMDTPGGPMFYSGVGLPQINPIVQGALFERQQFDGDIPEMRTGPLPEEVLPAIPIRTRGVRNPHMLGHMMHDAALRLGQKVQDRQRKQVADAEAQRALQRPADPLPLALRGGSADTDHPQYRRGQVPVPIPAPRVPASELDPVNAQHHVWQVIGTTQGRRSAAPVIEDMVLKALREKGLRVARGVGQGDALAQYQWTMNLAGMTQVQPEFNPIDTAARVLALSLEAAVAALESQDLLLEVRPVNNIADRMVGWVGLLWGMP